MLHCCSLIQNQFIYSWRLYRIGNIPYNQPSAKHVIMSTCQHEMIGKLLVLRFKLITKSLNAHQSLLITYHVLAIPTSGTGVQRASGVSSMASRGALTAEHPNQVEWNSIPWWIPINWTLWLGHHCLFVFETKYTYTYSKNHLILLISLFCTLLFTF